jgi:GTP cyclohydrolase FolE2
MNAPEKIFLPDIQATPDERALAIDRVGVKGVRYPLAVRTPSGASQPTVATFDLYVTLPPSVKGTHMSRFLELLEARREAFDIAAFGDLMRDMLGRLDADGGFIEARFPYFVEKIAPVSGVKSLMDYEVTFRAERRAGRDVELTLQVMVPVTSLCPCSKKISEYGAHNQRSHITMAATLVEPMQVEELVAIAEAQASCELFGLLKRPDEKYVTERAYDNPKFVEDLVRDIALGLDRDSRVAAFTVESENFESIHNHSAYALISRDKRGA